MGISASTMAYLAIASTVATTAVSYVSAQQTADRQKQLNAENTSAANANRVSEQTQVQDQEQLSDQAAYQKEDEQGRQTRAAVATAQTAAGQAGVSGYSVDALQQDYFNNMGRFDSDTETNRENDEQRLQLQSEGIAASTASQINNMPTAQDPSLLAAGLQIGGGVLKDEAL